jgi:hypothetical protein
MVLFLFNLKCFHFEKYCSTTRRGRKEEWKIDMFLQEG